MCRSSCLNNGTDPFETSAHKVIGRSRNICQLLHTVFITLLCILYRFDLLRIIGHSRDLRYLCHGFLNTGCRYIGLHFLDFKITFVETALQLPHFKRIELNGSLHQPAFCSFYGFLQLFQSPGFIGFFILIC